MSTDTALRSSIHLCATRSRPASLLASRRIWPRSPPLHSSQRALPLVRAFPLPPARQEPVQRGNSSRSQARFREAEAAAARGSEVAKAMRIAKCMRLVSDSTHFSTGAVHVTSAPRNVSSARCAAVSEMTSSSPSVLTSDIIVRSARAARKSGCEASCACVATPSNASAPLASKASAPGCLLS
eukprot:4612029-Pleurochrysis_carterae.AAC.1